MLFSSAEMLYFLYCNFPFRLLPVRAAVHRCIPTKLRDAQIQTSAHSCSSEVICPRQSNLLHRPNLSGLVHYVALWYVMHPYLLKIFSFLPVKAFIHLTANNLYFFLLMLKEKQTNKTTNKTKQKTKTKAKPNQTQIKRKKIETLPFWSLWL